MPEYVPDFQFSLDEVIKIDPSLKEIVDKHEFPAFFFPKSKNESSFEYLVRSILSQQVSGAAGVAILKKFLALLNCGPSEFPTPDHLLKFSVEELRTAGLSIRKGEYVRGLAEAYISGQLNNNMFKSLPDDEIVDRIVAIRGLGPWTAQMFLIFYLHRMDVFSIADIGVQRGMRRYMKERPTIINDLKVNREFLAPPSPGKSKKALAKSAVPTDLTNMELIAARFTPHRTAFQMILWKISDIQMDTVEARNTAAKAGSSIENVKKTPAKRKALAKQKTAAVIRNAESDTGTIKAVIVETETPLVTVPVMITPVVASKRRKVK